MPTITSGDLDATLRLWTDRLKDREPSKRLHALTVLGTLGGRALPALPAVMDLFKDPAPDVRRMAIAVVAEMGPDARTALPGLIGLLQDPAESVRRRAAAALCDFGPEARPAATALAQALADPSAQVRRWAAAALGEVGGVPPVAVDLLIGALRQEDMKTRAVVAAALGKMGSRAVARLTTALAHESAQVRRHAARTLAKLSSSDDTAARLGQLLADPDPAVREAASEALHRMAAKPEPDVQTTPPPRGVRRG